MRMYWEPSLAGSVWQKVSNNKRTNCIGILMNLTIVTLCGITDGAFPHYQIGGILTFLPDWAASITILHIIAAVALYK